MELVDAVSMELVACPLSDVTLPGCRNKHTEAMRRATHELPDKSGAVAVHVSATTKI